MSVLSAAVPDECCPACTSLSFSVKNASDDDVALVWSKSQMLHNNEPVSLVVDGNTVLVADIVASKLRAHESWTGHLRLADSDATPRAGKLKAGNYTVKLAVQRRHSDRVEWSISNVALPYGPDPALQATCSQNAMR